MRKIEKRTFFFTFPFHKTSKKDRGGQESMYNSVFIEWKVKFGLPISETLKTITYFQITSHLENLLPRLVHIKITHLTLRLMVT